MTTSTRISHKMHLALEAIRNGSSPKAACLIAGVSRQSLYRAMRREAIGTRCSLCGHILTGARALPAEPPDYEARVTALEDDGCTRSDAQAIVDAQIKDEADAVAQAAEDAGI